MNSFHWALHGAHVVQRAFQNLMDVYNHQSMEWFQWISLFALTCCLAVLGYHIYRLIRMGNPEDYARPAGSTIKGIRYSFTGAMNPKKKESAYLHLPTYTAGLLYHAGTFLAFLVFILSFFQFEYPDWMRYVCTGILLLTSISGYGIWIKRISKKIMRRLSNPDDFISNFLVSGFQLLTAWLLVGESYILIPYYLLTSALLLYIPVGKLKHMVYFFAARYHLGWFYGSRGTWPPKVRLKA